MEQTVKIHCRNNDTVIDAPIGSTLEEIYLQTGAEYEARADIRPR